MPTLITERGFRVVMYYNDHRPPHVHVKRAGNEARAKLYPVSIMDNYGFNRNEIRIVLEIVEKYQMMLSQTWQAIYGDQAMSEKRADHPIGVTITGEKITVRLADGREISNPIAWFPWLVSATPEQRANYELWPFSIDWPDLDNGIDIEGMLRGIKPPIPTTS